MKRVTAFHHPGYAAPIGTHIMPMRKFAMVAEAAGVLPYVDVRQPEPAEVDDVLRVHDRAYVDAIRTGEPRVLAESQKFPWSVALFPSVMLTAGGVIAAAREALSNGSAAALCSGFHHAHASRGEGFCTFNALVIALEKLHSEGLIRRGAVLDMDLHYGNGTALCCATRPHLTALSLYGSDYWDNRPYTQTTVLHHQDGPNHHSAALPNGCERAAMVEILHKHLPKLLNQGKPDLLLYQAGADPLFMDPYSPLNLTHDDLLERDRIVFQFARDHQIPIAWVLAGGYTHDIREVIAAHVNTFVAWNRVHNDGC